MITVMGTFGDNVRAKMLERGVTPNALAAKAGLSRSMIDKWLAADNPEYNTIMRVATLLETSVESLVARTHDEYDAMLARMPPPDRLRDLWTSLAQRDPLAAERLFAFLLALAHPEHPTGPAGDAEPSLGQSLAKPSA